MARPACCHYRPVDRAALAGQQIIRSQHYSVFSSIWCPVPVLLDIGYCRSADCCNGNTFHSHGHNTISFHSSMNSTYRKKLQAVKQNEKYFLLSLLTHLNIQFSRCGGRYYRSHTFKPAALVVAMATTTHNLAPFVIIAAVGEPNRPLTKI